MIVIQSQIPRENLIYKYNREYDILDIYLYNNRIAFSDEIISGVYEHFDWETEDLIGVSIENYMKMDKKKLYNILPLTLDFNYINNVIGVN